MCFVRANTKEAAFGRLHKGGRAAFGRPPPFVESLMDGCVRAGYANGTRMERKWHANGTRMARGFRKWYANGTWIPKLRSFLATARKIPSKHTSDGPK